MNRWEPIHCTLPKDTGEQVHLLRSFVPRNERHNRDMLTERNGEGFPLPSQWQRPQRNGFEPGLGFQAFAVETIARP